MTVEFMFKKLSISLLGFFAFFFFAFPASASNGSFTASNVLYNSITHELSFDVSTPNPTFPYPQAAVIGIIDETQGGQYLYYEYSDDYGGTMHDYNCSNWTHCDITLTRAGTATYAPNDTFVVEINNQPFPANGTFEDYDSQTFSPLASPPDTPPSVSSLQNTTLNEGDTYTASGSFTDPDSASWTATVDYGDGSGTQNLPLSGQTFSLNHQYTTTGVYTVLVTVTDDQNVSGTATAQIVVHDFTASNIAYNPTTHELRFDIANPISNFPYAQVSVLGLLDVTQGGQYVYYQYSTEYGGTMNDYNCNNWTHCDVTLTRSGSVAFNPNDTFWIEINNQPFPADGATFKDYHSQNFQGNIIFIVPNPTTLTPIADTYLNVSSQNNNEGSSPVLRLAQTGHFRTLVKFDESQIQAAVGNDPNFTATLQFTIADNGNNWGTTGRQIELDRMLQDWVEGNGYINGNPTPDRGTGSGTTWNCAIDTNISNNTKDCTGSNVWDMDNSANWPFSTSSTATTIITNHQSGVLSLDVTQDVKNFINGTNQNYGWLLKKTDETVTGKIDFGSRESSNSPVLIITPQ